ncbi:molybdenum cofactor biosynthesis protein 1 B [Rhizodiscina lignyota]|uniref:Molybdenum cofactor biosynthesis protein 1 B n=1 Tax=Rhizodiscina lignyota TaxID=1504668 RepID=A0A9P4IQF0_9PEZI|nr:molybdenum cofactor biosynthesis protein 1 B [Rhizodiscina lignyota]
MPRYAAQASSTRGSTPIPSPLSSRREAIKQAKPFSEFLTDTFNRHHDYLRISITERCNFRCTYCMPAEGVQLSPKEHLLTSPEIYYLSSLFVSEGVTKIRLTGGEPTVRRDILPLMHSIGSLRSKGLKELALTSNGFALHRKLDSMVDAGLTGVNLSLDTLDPAMFKIITRTDGYSAVMKSINRILEMKSLGANIKLKVNCVVMRKVNRDQIIPFVEFARDKDLEVRFIEYMPFGGNKWEQEKMFPYGEMLDMIRAKYPDVQRVTGHKNDTSKTYEIPGFVGKIGFITSMTDDFCGTCNRLRITTDGNLKVCLHGNAEVSLRDLLRKGNGGKPIDDEAFEALKRVEMDRHQGLLPPGTPLGWGARERELLGVIGAAVKRKKEKHAGMGELENMENRPMILIANREPKSGDSMIRFHGTRVHESDSENHPLERAVKEQLDQSNTEEVEASPATSLTHVNKQGAAHMVTVSQKPVTIRTATAVSCVFFSNSDTSALIQKNEIAKGDVLSVARLAGIQAAKRTPDIVPLCHPIPLTGVTVDLELFTGVPSWRRDLAGGVLIEAQCESVGQTGVEMEALHAAMVTALTVFDMGKAVDKLMKISGCHVVQKAGGKSGDWAKTGYEQRNVLRELRDMASNPDRKPDLEPRMEVWNGFRNFTTSRQRRMLSDLSRKMARQTMEFRNLEATKEDGFPKEKRESAPGTMAIESFDR